MKLYKIIHIVSTLITGVGLILILQQEQFQEGLYNAICFQFTLGVILTIFAYLMESTPRRKLFNRT